jgi:hypothetical protein
MSYKLFQTPLEDKNGKKIREGDVLVEVNFDYDHHHEYECFNKKGEYICDPYYFAYSVVRVGMFKSPWEEEFGAFTKGKHYGEPLRGARKKEFIGNIHKNPFKEICTKYLESRKKMKQQ